MKKRMLCTIVTILVPISVLILYSMQDFLISWVTGLRPCLFYSIYHLYCPSCGNTRSVIALLHGDIGSSLRFNIEIPILTILGVLGYIELAACSFGKQIRLLPRKTGFYICLIFFMFLYWIVRNFIPYLTP